MNKHSYSEYLVCSLTLKEIKDIIRTGESRVIYSKNEEKFTVFSVPMAKEVMRRYGERLIWIGENVTCLKGQIPGVDEKIHGGIKALDTFMGIYESKKKEPSYRDFINKYRR